MPDMPTPLPRSEDLIALLRLSHSEVVPEILERVLIRPVPSFVGRPGSEFRAQLLEFAFGIADQGRTPPTAARALCEKGIFMVEAIYAASRVLDEAEKSPLHVGQWLYAWPLERLKTWGLPPEQEIRIYRCTVQAVLQSQFGQAIDLGAGIDSLPQEKIADACLGSMELGSGTLMQLAAQLGALLGGAPAPLETTLADFGKSFGVALQMFDDIGSKYEALRLRRPSWVWSVAAQYSDAEEFARFREAVRQLPQPQAVDQWLENQALGVRAKALAIEYLNRAFDPLEDRLGAAQSLVWVRELGEKLRRVATL